MSNHVKIEVQGAVLHARLNRPEKKNALTLAMYERLTAAVERAETDEALRVLFLSGAGDSFTAGNDISDFVASPPTGPESPVLRFLAAITAAAKPVVAAVHGAAVGIGTTVLLHCDLVYAAEGARFQMPFVNLGLVPEAASSLLIPRLAGHARAAELLLLGTPFGADEAARMGLVSTVYPEGELMDQAWQKAQRLAALPPEAVRQSKALLRRETAEAVQARIHEEGALFVERLHSPEAAEAFQAFLERRSPDFSRFS